MTWRGYVLLIAVLALVFAGWHVVQRATTPPAPFRADVLAVVQHPDRVRVQRLLPMVGTTPPLNAAFYGQGNLVGTGKALEPSPDWIRRFRDRIVDGRSYLSKSETCSPKPMMVVRFVQGDRRVDVMLDFDCNTVLVQDDGKPSGVGNCDSCRDEFVKLAKQLFPDDREITSLPEG